MGGFGQRKFWQRQNRNSVVMLYLSFYKYRESFCQNSKEPATTVREELTGCCWLFCCEIVACTGRKVLW